MVKEKFYIDEELVVYVNAVHAACCCPNTTVRIYTYNLHLYLLRAENYLLMRHTSTAANLITRQVL
jgi:hypothetical protein